MFVDCYPCHSTFNLYQHVTWYHMISSQMQRRCFHQKAQQDSLCRWLRGDLSRLIMGTDVFLDWARERIREKICIFWVKIQLCWFGLAGWTLWCTWCIVCSSVTATRMSTMRTAKAKTSDHQQWRPQPCIIAAGNMMQKTTKISPPHPA